MVGEWVGGLGGWVGVLVGGCVGGLHCFNDSMF